MTSVAVSPPFGVSELTRFTLAATGSDPDGDALTFQWSIGAQRLNGPTQSAVIAGDGPVTVTATASDARGGTASGSQTVTI